MNVIKKENKPHPIDGEKCKQVIDTLILKLKRKRGIIAMIKRCTCKHDYQDKEHGKKMRVFNPTKQNGRELERGWRCTVCGREVN